jgi:hypothetical protein
LILKDLLINEMIFIFSATDCWGVGIIAYMLITGGKSPFYGGNRFRTMARILTCSYELESLPGDHCRLLFYHCILVEQCILLANRCLYSC